MERYRDDYRQVDGDQDRYWASAGTWAAVAVLLAGFWWIVVRSAMDLTARVALALGQ